MISIATCLALIAMVAAPSATPARGDAPMRLAVTTFQNQAGAPAAVVNALSASLYQSISSSGSYTAVGGGPLAFKPDLIGGSFGPALDAASKVGADEVVVGNIVSYANGQAFYSLSVYRTSNVMLVRTQVFSQNYPPSDAHALVAGFASNLNTLEAPRTAMGTIYSDYNGELDADLGTTQGFSLGQQFNVLRDGQKVAEATITKISDDFAVVTIVNPSAGYKPAIGDRLVGLNAQPALQPVHSTASGFNPLYIVLGAAVALLAIGHGGSPAAANPQPTASGGPGFFTASNLATVGNPQQQPITFTFTFSEPFNTELFDPSSDTSLAYVNLTSQGTNFVKLNQLGPATFLPTATAATSLQIISSDGIIQPTDHVMFFFLDNTSGNGWVDNNGDPFVGAEFSPFGGHRRPAVVHVKVHAPPPVVVPPVPVPHPARSPQ